MAVAALEAGIPFQHLPLSPEAESAKVYRARLVLVRPDGHVAWRGDRVGLDGADILALAVGRAAVTATVTAAHEQEAHR
jgi:hypothetical protein